MPKEKNIYQRNYLLIWLLAMTGVIVVAGLIGTIGLTWRWVIVIAAMLGFLMVVGKDRTVREYPDAAGKTLKTKGRYDGVLIDDRNKMSLSRFQIILWTILALSSWSALVLHRTIPVFLGTVRQLASPLARTLPAELARRGIKLEAAELAALYSLLTGEEELPADEEAGTLKYDPLRVRFPNELLLAMGISTTSLALSAVIKTDKSRTESGRALDLYRSELQNANDALLAARNAETSLNREITRATAAVTAAANPSQARDDAQAKLTTLTADRDLMMADVQRAQQRVSELQETDKLRMGVLHVNEKVEDAKWSDLFSGEKIQDYQHVDIAKVQMFFFTVIIVVAYGALIWAQMSQAGAERILEVLPQVSLPSFSESLVALLGLSHAGYITVKTAA